MLQTFRFEDEIQLESLSAHSQNIYTPEKLLRKFFLLKKSKPSPYNKMIKSLTVHNLFPPLRHSDSQNPVVE